MSSRANLVLRSGIDRDTDDSMRLDQTVCDTVFERIRGILKEVDGAAAEVRSVEVLVRGIELGVFRRTLERE